MEILTVIFISLTEFFRLSANAVSKKLYPQDITKVSGGKVVTGKKINDIRLNKASYKKKQKYSIFRFKGMEM